MALTVVDRSSSPVDLVAVYAAFACCARAVFQAWHDQDPALLSLLEAEVDALNVVLAAIRQAAGPRCSQHPGPA